MDAQLNTGGRILALHRPFSVAITGLLVRSIGPADVNPQQDSKIFYGYVLEATETRLRRSSRK
jgi:hypothetical protein